VIATVAKKRNGKADVPVGTDYRVVSDDGDTLTIEMPDPDPMQVVLEAVASVGPDALVAAVTLAQGLIDARATLDAARTASATTSARSVAAALTAAVDAGKAAAEEATDPKTLP
jgi:hypothetical protein